MTQISNVYAEALFELSFEENKTSEYLEQLSKLCAFFQEEPEYIQLLDAPSIPVSERCSALSKAFEEHLCEHIMSMMLLLCEECLVYCLQDVFKIFSEMVRISEGVVLCKVISAAKLTDEEEKELSAAIEKRMMRRAELHFEVDPTIIGGIIIEADGKIYDGSLKKKLVEMKEVIKK